MTVTRNDSCIKIFLLYCGYQKHDQHNVPRKPPPTQNPSNAWEHTKNGRLTIISTRGPALKRSTAKQQGIFKLVDARTFLRRKNNQKKNKEGKTSTIVLC